MKKQRNKTLQQQMTDKYNRFQVVTVARPVVSSTGRIPETELGFYDTMCYRGHFCCDTGQSDTIGKIELIPGFIL